jgi:hypothetical protein
LSPSSLRSDAGRDAWPRSVRVVTRLFMVKIYHVKTSCQPARDVTTMTSSCAKNRREAERVRAVVSGVRKLWAVRPVQFRAPPVRAHRGRASGRETRHRRTPTVPLSGSRLSISAAAASRART